MLMHARSRVSRRTADSSLNQFPEEMEPVYEELYEAVEAQWPGVLKSPSSVNRV